MKFGKISRGGFVAPVPGISPAELRSHLPARLQAHANADAFLFTVVERVCLVAEMAADDGDATPAQLRDQLDAIRVAAHSMSHALASLAGKSEVFDVLAPHFHYLHLRAHEVNMPTEGRPKVPPLPPDVPELPELLARVASDVHTLRTACEYTAKHIRPVRNLSKGRERQLVELVAEAYVDAFGKPPPKRGTWFADTFVPYLGSCVGLDIGHRVVGDIIRNLPGD